MSDPIAPVAAAAGVSKKWVWIAVAAVGVYFAWRYFAAKKQEQSSPVATSVPSQAPNAPDANGTPASTTVNVPNPILA